MSIFFVSFVLLAELASLSWLIVAVWLGGDSLVPSQIRPAVMSILFGGIGGCAYCLRGVYLNACVRKSWDTAWLPWYGIRPFISLVFGGVSYLFVKSGLLLFNATEDPNTVGLGIWAVAFLAGFNVDKFVAKIEAVGQTVWGIDPSRQTNPVKDASHKKDKE